MLGRKGQPRPKTKDLKTMKSYVLTVSCKSTRGIVAAITGYLADEGCYITDSSQFDDLETGLFFMRLTFISQEGASLETLEKGFEAVKARFGMNADIRDSEHRMKVLLMVSRFGHCLNDLLYRWKIGALPIEIVGVVSRITSIIRRSSSITTFRSTTYP